MNQAALWKLFQLNQSVWGTISKDPATPQSVKTMVYLHLQKPWVPDFLAVAISPLNLGLDRYLGDAVFEYIGLTFYYPSIDWWFAHARTSHPPDGAGCNAQAHADFLTAGGANAEFMYANVSKSGAVKVLDRSDFEEECAFWASGTGS